MREMYNKGELNEDQKAFFEPTKPKEELYNLIKDPHQINNLEGNSEYKAILKKLRAQTLVFDEKIIPVSDTRSISYVPGQPFVKWFKKEHPEAHQQMKEGVEVGFKKYVSAYKEHLENN